MKILTVLIEQIGRCKMIWEYGPCLVQKPSYSISKLNICSAFAASMPSTQNQGSLSFLSHPLFFSFFLQKNNLLPFHFSDTPLFGRYSNGTLLCCICSISLFLVGDRENIESWIEKANELKFDVHGVTKVIEAFSYMWFNSQILCVFFTMVQKLECGCSDLSGKCFIWENQLLVLDNQKMFWENDSLTYGRTLFFSCNKLKF